MGVGEIYDRGTGVITRKVALEDRPGREQGRVKGSRSGKVGLSMIEANILYSLYRAKNYLIFADEERFLSA